MPILTVTVAPDLITEVQSSCDELSADLLLLIRKHLAPAKGTEQIMFVPAFGAVTGCSILAHLVHRASDSRTTDVRNNCAREIADHLSKTYDCSVRVRLIATNPDDIAAADIFLESEQ
jgi:hypothetical protein|tara:strand:+ start:309 stop:662 length:354 start_codon:yes stop_codon:yes gene_type:complete